MSKEPRIKMGSVFDRLFLEPLRHKPQPGTQQTPQESSSPPPRSEKPVSEVSRTSVIHMEDLSEDDIIIAVMGPTGAGKSTFIQAATGHAGSVGHGIQSYTTEIESIRCYDRSRSLLEIVFVDTPGFDDTNKSDLEILTMIADWLEKTYKKRIKLTGIVYLHRISDSRITGTPLKNLRMFETLCGKEALERVTLATTMWSEVDEDTGRKREEDLRTNYWNTMLDQGSTATRFDGTPDSAWKIVGSLTNEPERRHAVQLQQELVDIGRQLPETHAGRTLFGIMEELVQRQRVMLEKIRVESKRQDNEAALDALHKEFQDVQQHLAKTLLEMQVLKVSPGKRFLRTVSSSLRMSKK